LSASKTNAGAQFADLYWIPKTLFSQSDALDVVRITLLMSHHKNICVQIIKEVLRLN